MERTAPAKKTLTLEQFTEVNLLLEKITGKPYEEIEKLLDTVIDEIQSFMTIGPDAYDLT